MLIEEEKEKSEMFEEKSEGQSNQTENVRENQINMAQDILLKPLEIVNSNSGKLTPIIEPRLKIQVNKTTKNSPIGSSE